MGFLKTLLELFAVLSHHSFLLPPPFSLDKSFPSPCPFFFWLRHRSPLRMSLSGRQGKTALHPFSRGGGGGGGGHPQRAFWDCGLPAGLLRADGRLWLCGAWLRLSSSGTEFQWVCRSPGWVEGGHEIPDQPSSVPTLFICRGGLATFTPALYCIMCAKS